MNDTSEGDPPRKGLLIGGIVLVGLGWLLGAVSLVMDWEFFGLGAAFALFIAGLVVTRSGARRAGLAPGRLAGIVGVAIFAVAAPVVALTVALDFTRVW